MRQVPLACGIAIRANDRRSFGGGRASTQARGDTTIGNLTRLVATTCPQSEPSASFLVSCKADFFSGQLFGQLLKETLGFDGAFVFANQFCDNFNLPLDLRMKMLNTRTAPGYGPRPLCCSATQEVGSGSNELGPVDLKQGPVCSGSEAWRRAASEGGRHFRWPF